MANRGGRRVGAGRKRNDPPTRKISLSLTEEQVRLLRMWGRGDVSAGLRWLVEAAIPHVYRPPPNELTV